MLQYYNFSSHKLYHSAKGRKKYIYIYIKYYTFITSDLEFLGTNVL